MDNIFPSSFAFLVFSPRHELMTCHERVIGREMRGAKGTAAPLHPNPWAKAHSTGSQGPSQECTQCEGVGDCSPVPSPQSAAQRPAPSSALGAAPPAASASLAAGQPPRRCPPSTSRPPRPRRGPVAVVGDLRQTPGGLRFEDWLCCCVKDCSAQSSRWEWSWVEKPGGGKCILQF